MWSAWKLQMATLVLANMSLVTVSVCKVLMLEYAIVAGLWNVSRVSSVGEACGCVYVVVLPSQSAVVLPKQSVVRI